MSIKINILGVGVKTNTFLAKLKDDYEIKKYFNLSNIVIIPLYPYMYFKCIHRQHRGKLQKKS